jgi:hypothetical protein
MVKPFCNKCEYEMVYVFYIYIGLYLFLVYLLMCHVVSYTGVPRLPVVIPSVWFCPYWLLFRAVVRMSSRSCGV